MADLEGVPQWKRDLIRRRRALQQSQSAAKRGHADMLLQSPAAYDLTDPTDCSEDGSTTERSTPLRDTDTHADSSEELTYGPGIVKKLKSRYLSLTLRETNKSRPSIHGLRRATSLEHVLEDEKPAPPPRKYQPSAVLTTRQTRYRQPTRTPDAVRRARSVDALARCDSRSESDSGLLSPVEQDSPTTREPPQPSLILRPKRPTPLLKDAERPPPDLVKQALKIFEGQPGKKLRTPSTGQVADKVKSYSETQKQVKKTTPTTNGARLPRPAIPPRGPLIGSPEHKQIPVATQTTPSLYSRPPPSPKKFVNHREDKERSISPVYVNRHPVILAPVDTSPVKSPSDFSIFKGFKPLELKSPDLSPRNSILKSPDLVSPRDKPFREIREVNGLDTLKDPYIRTSTPDLDVFTQPASTEISLIAPAAQPIRKFSDRQASESSSEDDPVFMANEEETPKTKVIEKSALEEISKASTTTQFSFNSNSDVNAMNGDVKKSYLPSAKQKSCVNSNKSENSVSSNISDKSKVPDLIQIANSNNNSAAMKSPTVADAKLISPVTHLIIPKRLEDNANAVSPSAVPSKPTTSEVVTTCPTSYGKEPRAVLDVRQVKDIESSPPLVHYESPSPPPHYSKSLTSREIEKNFINTSKSLLEQPVVVNNNKSASTDDPIVSDSCINQSLDQPLKKVTVSMLEGPDKAKVNSKNNNNNSDNKKQTADDRVAISVKETATVSGVVSVVENTNGDVVTKSVVSDASVVTSVLSNGGGFNVTNKLGSGRKPQWHQQETTTMLFDFSKRKGVPDYIENDGMIRRRDKPKIGVGVISIDGLSGESCTDGASDSGDEDWGRRPPSPCDVAFENDNIVINGRSNISAGRARARHLKIQFDESLTTTFEYPSEASLGEEHFAGTNSSSSPASPIATGGPLSSYTPSKVSLQADTFQLGVTRSHTQTTEKNGNGSSTNGDVTDMGEPSSNGTSSSSDDRKSTEEPYLKPCLEDESHNWSHETHIGAGDLLF